MQVQIELSIKPLQRDQVIIQIDQEQVVLNREQVVINSKKAVVPITIVPQAQDRHLQGPPNHLIRGLPVHQVDLEVLQAELEVLGVDLEVLQAEHELVNLVNSIKKL